MRLKKYLTGGQVELDKNKDGKITGEDFKLMRTKKKGMYAKGGMKMYAGKGTKVKMYADGGDNEPVKTETPEEKLKRFMETSKKKGDPKAVLQRLTTNAIREELRKAGVGGKYSIGDKGSVEADYDKLVEMAKAKGVYDAARSSATKEFKENYGKPGYQFLEKAKSKSSSENEAVKPPARKPNMTKKELIDYISGKR